MNLNRSLTHHTSRTIPKPLLEKGNRMAYYNPFHPKNLEKTHPSWLSITITIALLLSGGAFLFNLLFLPNPAFCVQAASQIEQISKIIMLVMALSGSLYLAELFVFSNYPDHWRPLEDEQFRIKIEIVCFWGSVIYFLISPYIYRWLIHFC